MATEHVDLSAFDPEEFDRTEDLRVGIVSSLWNREITESLEKGAKDTLLRAGLVDGNIISWQVPGSFELIYGCRRLYHEHQPDAMIAIGSIIQGETRHFEFVASAVAQGIKDLNIQLDCPVIFCVLTDDHIGQARDRSGGKHGNKGVEAAVAALRMALLGG